jgi:hypothetical protein
VVYCLSPPLSMLLPWFNNLHGVLPLRTAMRFLPLLLPLHLPPPPSCSCPSHGDNGNARLRFYSRRIFLIILIFSRSRDLRDGRALVVLQAFVLGRTRHSPWRSKNRGTKGGEICCFSV